MRFVEKTIYSIGCVLIGISIGIAMRSFGMTDKSNEKAKLNPQQTKD